MTAPTAHAHAHSHAHADAGAHADGHGTSGAARRGTVVVVRPNSGLSGDMLLAGLARLAGADDAMLATMAAALGLPDGAVVLERRSVAGVLGWGCRVSLPHEHAHRTLADIDALIAASALDEDAKKLASRTFRLLAEAEGRVHGIAPDEVTFHEVGALDSILDIGLVAALFARIAPARLVCGPLPLCDGTVRCAHGLLPTPAPAVLEMLDGVPVRGIDTAGETVTPTALALLKGLGAEFGGWPRMKIDGRALVYGTRVLPGVANGAIFAIGEAG